MNRRSFLVRALAAGAVAGSALRPGLAAAQEKFDVRNLRITDVRTILVDAGSDENYARLAAAKYPYQEKPVKSLRFPDGSVTDR